MNLLKYSKTLNYKENKILVNYCIRLHSHIEGSQVSVAIGEDLDHEYKIGAYKINIFKEEDPWLVLSSVLHEYGHFLDEYYNPHLFFYVPNHFKSKRVYTVEEVELELHSEDRAWYFAEGTARILNVPLQEWFFNDKTKSLKSYSNWAKRKIKRLVK